MDEAAIIQYIIGAFEGVETETSAGNTFFFFGPERQMPWATIATKDDYDRASHLDRPEVFRLNIGITKATYLSLFGAEPPRPGPDGVVNTGHDFTALNQIMPHPVYAPMYWVCVLSPSAITFQESVRTLLAEAFDQNARRLAP